MNPNLELLDAIYQSAAMAANSLEALMPKAEATPLYTELDRQQSEYQSFAVKADELSAAYQQPPQQPGALQKAAQWAGIQWNSLLDTSPSHLAGMVIQGGQSSVTDLTRQLKEHCLCDKPVTALGQDLLQYEQRALEQMKQYL